MKKLTERQLLNIEKIGDVVVELKVEIRWLSRELKYKKELLKIIEKKIDNER